MLGRAIAKTINDQGGTVLAVPRKTLDLRDREATANWLADQTPDAVIMAAARVGGIADNLASQGEMCADNLAIALPTNLFEPSNARGERAHGIPSLLHRFHNAVLTHQPQIEIWGTGRSK